MIYILNLLKRSMYGCTKQAKARAYTALVRPHLEFSAPVWTPHGISDQSNLDKVLPGGYVQGGIVLVFSGLNDMIFAVPSWDD